jgi:hypothetical protein
MAKEALSGNSACSKRPKAALGEAKRYFEEVVLAYDGAICLLWPYGRTCDEYGVVGGGSVHRRVCEAVNGPPPSPSHQAAHTCGQGHLGCVARRHLVWKTPKENVADTLVHGTRNRGQRNGWVKLNESQVKHIRRLRGVLSQRKRAALFKVGQTTVRDIDDRKTWAWLDV